MSILPNFGVIGIFDRSLPKSLTMVGSFCRNTSPSFLIRLSMWSAGSSNAPNTVSAFSAARMALTGGIVTNGNRRRSLAPRDLS